MLANDPKLIENSQNMLVKLIADDFGPFYEISNFSYLRLLPENGKIEQNGQKRVHHISKMLQEFGHIS